jgi:hypothetical protein
MNSESESKEPDETPVEPRHVEAFLAWYGKRVALPRYTGLSDQWCHALQTLNLGQLRKGIVAAAQHSPPAYLEPPRFWCVCMERVSFGEALKTQQLRRSLRR